LDRQYRVQEFAELAGVTVKALHHYDRIGLLQPRRTVGGYRVYTGRDLERLEQILALKFLGLPLRQIQAVLSRPALELHQVLRVQREALQEKRRIVDRAIRAIETAEAALASGQPADSTLLKPIMEAIDMRDSIESMKKYYSEEAWVKQRPRYEQGPSPEWRELYRKIGASLGNDPSGEEAVALAGRWIEMTEADNLTDPEVLLGRAKAWQDRAHWPAALQQEIAEFQLEKVYAYVGKALRARGRKNPGDSFWIRRDHRVQVLTGWHEWFLEVRASFAEQSSWPRASAQWAEFLHRNPSIDREVQDRSLQAWEDRQQEHRRICGGLYRDVVPLLDESPEAPEAQSVAQRWLELWELYLCGDVEVRAAWREACPPNRRERISDWLGLAVALPMRRYYSEAWHNWMERRKRVTEESRQAAAREWISLYRQIEAAVAEDSESGKARELAVRWWAALDADDGGEEIRAGMRRAWADRANWPAVYRRHLPLLYLTDSDNFDRAANALDQALAAES
jgi:DNA-binding transcriptional MerR regulator